MNNQYIMPIDKLMLWRSNNWTKYDSTAKPGLSKFALHIHYDQLMILSDNKLLETFNMNSKMKGIYKEDILILIVSVAVHEIRKLKFQIKSDVTRCLQKLGEHFPVINHNSLPTKNKLSKFCSVDVILKHALDNTECVTSLPLPADYGNFIKLCLLDPTFPQIVTETNTMLQEIISKDQ